ETNEQVVKIEEYEEEDDITGVAFTPDGKQVVATSSNGTIRVFEIPSGKEVNTIKLKEGIEAFALSPDGKQVLVAGGQNYTVAL
ncbi:hypothetical protein U2075_14860, partial [Listeria monocytogenes]|uniref:WD40 repeat domain-containing protein n=1 Tax=Listeria monocytogenes TaxID=1639 RepID=UPI002FDBB658